MTQTFVYIQRTVVTAATSTTVFMELPTGIGQWYGFLSSNLQPQAACYFDFIGENPDSATLPFQTVITQAAASDFGYGSESGATKNARLRLTANNAGNTTFILELHYQKEI